MESNGSTIDPNRIVIYTAIFGKKDDLVVPSFLPANCDLICFTDQDIQSRMWQVRRVSPPEKDPTRSARKYKILVHKFLPEYRTSIWVDGNVLIRGDFNELVRDYLADANLAVIDQAACEKVPAHTLAEEEERLLRMERAGKHQEDPELVRKQGEAYRTLGYPDTSGLAWTLLLLRRHNELDVQSAMEAWWQELVTWTKRDQMSFNYSAWKTGLHFNYIPLDGGENVYFKRLNHYLSPAKKINSLRIGAMKRMRRLFGDN